MRSQPTATQVRIINLTTCLTVTANSLDILADSVETPFLGVISNTTRALLTLIQTVKQNKDDCVQLTEKAHELLSAIIALHLKSDTGGELTPNELKHVGKFAQTLCKIHNFIETRQRHSTVHRFLHRGEMSTLLKDCRVGLQQALDFFQIKTFDLITDVRKIQQDAQKIHQDVLTMIETMSDATGSDRASLISRLQFSSHNSSNSFSMLPSKPKIFHGRESELSHILELFAKNTTRTVILGAGGMGKTSLAKAAVHHTELTAKYKQHRHFVSCDSATNRVELAALIGSHLGLSSSKDLTRSVVQHFSGSPPSLLILDNLETVWEPIESRGDIEEFLSLLADVDHLSLIITMRGAERPAQVQWTRPFLPPLQPLGQDAARQIFLDIADDSHSLQDVDKVLSLTDNMPLAISLLAHLVDSKGATNILSRWEEEKTSLISEGNDQRSNLDLSISLSLSSPRIQSVPHAQDLLSLLSMLPDGLSEVELRQSSLPIENILRCKAVLLRTALAYSDEHKRLKVLVPIREYMQKMQPPGNHLVRPLLKYFQELLEVFVEYHGIQSHSGTVARVASNSANIQSILGYGLRPGHPALTASIYCTIYLNQFTRFMGQGATPLIHQIQSILPQPCDRHLEASFITESLDSWRYSKISDHESFVSQAIEHFEQLDDLELKSRFYIGLADYHMNCKRDIPTALRFCEMAISVAISGGQTQKQCIGLYNLAMMKWQLGDYLGAQVHANECQRISMIAADLYREARALHVEAQCLVELGNYKRSLALCERAWSLLRLCGIPGGKTLVLQDIMSTLAHIFQLKSEYIEAYKLLNQILKEFSASEDHFGRAFALLNVAEMEVPMDAPKDTVEKRIDAAKSIFEAVGFDMGATMCDTILADLYLREGDILSARILFEKCLKFVGHPQIRSFCLERVADVRHWGSLDMFSWTVIFLVHSLKFKEKLGIYKALRFLGDVFISQDEEETAHSLFTVALGGFTFMDVHCSRAECMLHLGDISKAQGNALKAVELWETARPLFERSSQTKQLELINGRLTGVGDDVREHYRKSLVIRVELNPTSGVQENAKYLSDTEDLDLDDEEEHTLVAV